jgi:hypothetical protein
VVDDNVGILDPTQRLSAMTLLSARCLARSFPQARRPRRLLQPVTRRWLAAVAAVQPQSAFQFAIFGLQCSVLRFQHRKSLLQRGVLRLQRRNSLVLGCALRQKQLNLLNQLLYIGGSFHPTLEFDSSPLSRFFTSPESIRRTEPTTGRPPKIGNIPSGYLGGYIR